MTKRTIGTFFIISIIMDIVGVGMIIGGLIGSTTYTTNNGYSTGTLGNGPLFAIGVILVSLSAIPYLVAWIGALVNLARLQQWVWFVLMLIFQWITLLIYLIAGPTTPRFPQYAPYVPPQQPQNYPQPPYYNSQQPQNYPQQPQYNPQSPQYNPQAPQYNPESQQNNPQPPQEYPRS